MGPISHKNNFTIKNIKRHNRYFHFLVGIFVFMVSFMGAALVSSIFTPVSSSYAEESTIKNDTTGFYVTVTNSDNVTLSVDATPIGQLAAAKDMVNVKTNAPLGYKLLLSTSSTDIYSSTDTDKTGKHFSATTGTLENPTVLGQNTWGFSLNAVSTPIPDTSSTWAGLTTAGTQIAKSNTATSSDGDNIDVYYGINANTNLETGTYTTTVTYTAVAEGTVETPLMQDFTFSDCLKMATNSTTDLMDKRNGKTYTVVKAQDGNCWMADNLVIYNQTISSADSDLPAGTSINLPASSNWNTNNYTDMLIHIADGTGSNADKTGAYNGEVYYNWCASLGKTNCDEGANVTVNQSICPKGWSLPVNGDATQDKSWAKLMNAYGVTTGAQLMDSSNSAYVLGLHKYYGGWYYNYNSERNQGSYGEFWSSTANSDTTAYHFYYNSSNIYSSGGANKGLGISIRCVFAPTMQEFTVEDCANMTTDTTAPLVDTRNGKSYNIVKARDGNCWMADNLKYQNVASSNWNTNDYSQELLHIATNSGYAGEYYYNYTSALSVCPKGWSLPVNGGTTQDKSYAKLMNAYGVTKGSQLLDNSNAAYILGFHKYYGDWRWNTADENGQGVRGILWSSIAYSDTEAYNFAFYDAEIFVNGYNDKGYGATVRCVQDTETMQTFTMQDCANMATDTTKMLIDTRNGKGYNVVKARDGNCWMADNLSIYNQTISDADSNLPTGTSITLPESTNWNTNDTTNMRVHIATNSGYEGEVYYNWCSAIGETNCGNYNVNGTTVNSSICPKGWRLPINGDATTDKSYAKLMNAYSATTGAQLIDPSDPSYILGMHSYYGRWEWTSDSESHQGLAGIFWTATAYSTPNSYDFNYNREITNMQYNSKGYGFGIRCVQEDRTLSDVTYMQDVYDQICANTAVGTTAQLLDKRGQGNNGAGTTTKYGVLKAKDGNCWMTDNLNLYNKQLTINDTDIPSTITLPESTTWNSNITNAMKIHVATNTGYEGEVYYNWCASIGKSTCTEGANVTVNQSICPKYWRLPINGAITQDKSWAKLMNAYGITTGAQLLAQANLGFGKYYGFWHWSNASEYEQGAAGYLWSSTAYSGTFAYYLYYNSTKINSQDNNASRGHGFSIRCVTK